jgi:cysteine synthase A
MNWLHTAIAKIEADYQRSADTHLIALPLPGFARHGIDLYLKDESTHPTGSLKHRLARSLFLYGLCNGWLHEGSTVVESSSGSTAVSEAYFARLLGLPFIAVMPRETSCEKIAQIEFYGGRCHLVDSATAVYDEARALAAQTGGHYMDQFTFAERATDWRSSNNIAQSMFTQMARERFAVPRWIVVGAGTGGTSATIGRYVRYQRHATQLCVADPVGSVFGEYHRTRQPQPDRAGLTHRRHWPSASGAQFYPHAGGPHDRRGRCGFGRCHALSVRPAGTQSGAIHRYQLHRHGRTGL